MSRLVRDGSLHSGIKVKLQISGEDTELDKNVIEELSDPLVHILRNSIDHGIEAQEDRVSKDKPVEDLVKLRAFFRGKNIIIEIQSAGTIAQDEDRCVVFGMPKEAIRSGAAEKIVSLHNIPNSISLKDLWKTIIIALVMLKS